MNAISIVLIILIIILVGIIIYLYLDNNKQYQKATNDVFTLFLNGAYEQRINWFKTLNKYTRSRPSVFVGDSITQEFLLTEVFNEYNVCNRGIGGDTTVGVLNRMNESIYDLNPGKLFLMIGTNDIELDDRSSEKIVVNIRGICEKSLDKIPDLEVYIVSLYPVSEQNDLKIDRNTVGKRTNKQIDEINIMLKELSKELEATYIDINSILKDDNNNLKIEYTREGLHISPYGYELIEKVYKKYL